MNCSFDHIQKSIANSNMNTASYQNYCTNLNYIQLWYLIIIDVDNSGADPTQDNESGHSPAAYTRHPQIKSLLERAGQQVSHSAHDIMHPTPADQEPARARRSTGQSLSS